MFKGRFCAARLDTLRSCPDLSFLMSVARPDILPSVLPEPFAGWFAARGWTPRAHQLALLEKARAGRSTLLIAPTGAGKTLAGFLPTLVELAARDAGRRLERGARDSIGLH